VIWDEKAFNPIRIGLARMEENWFHIMNRHY